MQYNYSERSEARSTSRKLIHNFVARNVESIGPAQKLIRGCSTPYEFLTSLIVGSKFTVFALFYFVFEGNFQVQAPGGLIFGGRFNGGFFALRVWGLIFGGADTWRGLFSVFYGIFVQHFFHTRHERYPIYLLLQDLIGAIKYEEKLFLVEGSSAYPS